VRCRLGRCLSLRCRCLFLCGLGLGLLRSRCRFRLGFLRWLSFSLLRRWLGRCLFLCGLGLDLLRGRVLAAVPVARCLVARTRGRLTGASGVLALLRRLRRLGINLGRGLDLGLLLTLVILGLRRLSLDLLRCLDLRLLRVIGLLVLIVGLRLRRLGLDALGHLDLVLGRIGFLVGLRSLG